MAADELAIRLTREHAMYIHVRDKAVSALAATLWARASADHMKDWSVEETMPPVEKAIFSTPASPKLQTKLSWKTDVTQPVRNVITIVRGTEKAAESEEYEDEVLRVLARQLKQLIGDTRYSINCKRVYSKDYKEKTLTMTITFILP
jgi:hypothetical protein